MVKGQLLMSSEEHTPQPPKGGCKEKDLQGLIVMMIKKVELI